MLSASLQPAFRPVAPLRRSLLWRRNASAITETPNKRRLPCVVPRLSQAPRQRPLAASSSLRKIDAQRAMIGRAAPKLETLVVSWKVPLDRARWWSTTRARI